MIIFHLYALELGAYSRGVSSILNRNSQVLKVPTSSEIWYSLSMLGITGEYLY